MNDLTNHPIGITVLSSGSKGNATLVHCNGNGILIDAGLSYREFKKRLAETGLDNNMKIHGILITHEHSDHVKGLRVCAEALEVPIFTTRKCAEILRSRDKAIGALTLIAAGGTFEWGGFSIRPFSVPHDANDPIAFTIRKDSSKVGIATDFGNANQVVHYELKECDAIVLESNHDLNMLAASSRPWTLKQRIMGPQGHLSNVASAQLLQDVLHHNLQHVILAHLSHECNTAELAWNASFKCLQCCQGFHPALSIARQDAPLDTVWIP